MYLSMVSVEEDQTEKAWRIKAWEGQVESLISHKVSQVTADGSSLEPSLDHILWKCGCRSLRPCGSVFGPSKEILSSSSVAGFVWDSPSILVHLEPIFTFSAWRAMVLIEKTCNTELEGQSSLGRLLSFVKIASPWYSSLLHQLYIRLVVRMCSLYGDFGKSCIMRQPPVDDRPRWKEGKVTLEMLKRGDLCETKRRLKSWAFKRSKEHLAPRPWFLIPLCSKRN